MKTPPTSPHRATCRPTGLVALVPHDEPSPVGEVATQLAAAGHSPRILEPEAHEAWRLAVGPCTVSCAPVREHAPSLLRSGLDLSDQECAAGMQARVAIRVRGPLEPPVVSSFHERLRLLHAAAGAAIAVFDDGLGGWRSGCWLRSAATSSLPPDPRKLFAVHAVSADSGDPAAPVWLHTHGLDRCGTVELEMLDVPGSACGVMVEVLDTVASIFLVDGMPAAGEVFRVAHEFGLAWLPWERAVKTMPPRGPGAARDRDRGHRGRRGVLVMPRRGLGRRRWLPAARCLERCRDALMVRLPDAEARRRGAVAILRFPAFRELVCRFGADPQWRFLAELGYAADGAESTQGFAEHMWFEVHGVDGARIDATLLDAPQLIARLCRGQRGWHAADQLGAWAVVSPHGVFEPDDVDVLLARVGGARGVGRRGEEAG